MKNPTLLTLPQPVSSVSVLLLAVMALGTAGCETLNGFAQGEVANPLAASQPDTHLFAAIPKGKMNTAPRQLAAEGLKALDAKDYKKASDLFNLAVKTEITNSYLHFLNGVAYQLRGINGESNLFPLAEQGFEMAVRFDNSNWLARYYSGLLAMYQHDYRRAQTRLAEAALYAPKQPELLYDLAAASYYNHDPKVAAAALEGLRKTQLGHADDPKVLRASAIVAAALNNGAEAESYLSKLRAAAIGDDIGQVENRVASWLDSYKRGGLIKAQFPGAGGAAAEAQPGEAQPAEAMPGEQQAGVDPAADPNAQTPAAGGAENFVEKQMAVVDVTILSTEEDNTNAMGVNLLDGLKIQFGNPTALTPAFSRTTTWNNDLIAPASTTATSVITRMIQVPAITYSLNIANSNAKRNEVLARPTLVALGNQPSSFFSGQDIVGAAVSGGQGSSVQIQKEVGVKLSVTPQFLPDNLIKLNVVAERTFLAIPSTSVKFDFRLDTNKTLVNANVVMKFGETLILSGLSERDQTKDQDGVPVLQDVPIVQYLFSRKVTRDYYKSVLILLTPRRAQFTNRSDEDIANDRANLSPNDLAMAEFEDKYKIWFKPTPNVAEITKALNAGTLFREFRTGDLAASWNRAETHEEKLKSAIKFLYF